MLCDKNLLQNPKERKPDAIWQNILGRLWLKKGCFDDDNNKFRGHQSIRQPTARWEDIFS
jgi:hypothetical protein